VFHEHSIYLATISLVTGQSWDPRYLKIRMSSSFTFVANTLKGLFEGMLQPV
jgi:hypothetical protein